jgi:hypothetical protein
MLACDFFTVETLWLGRHVLFFIELGTRRVHVAGCTANPDVSPSDRGSGSCAVVSSARSRRR